MNLKEIMKETLSNMWEEVMSAKNYYELYCEYKEEYPTLANTFLEIAPIELSHYDKMKKSFEESLSIMKTKGIEIPEYLFEIWKFELMRLQEFYDKVKYKIASR